MSAEAAFQAQKLDCSNRKNISIKNKFQHYLAHQAKIEGKKVPLREDWEEVKDEIMYKVVLTKFSQHRNLREKLLSTGDAELIEGNCWRDRYWGVYPENGEVDKDGLNKLGKILMRVREELK